MSFEFTDPEILALLLLIPFLIAWQRHKSTQRLQPSLLYPGNTATPGLRPSLRLTLMPSIPILRYSAIALLVMSMARPVILSESEYISRQGVDIVIVLDVSGSMAQNNGGTQTRLEEATSVIIDFISSRTNEAFGLVAFAAQPLIISPPTLDQGYLVDILGRIQTAEELGIEEGSAVGMGLSAALNLLSESLSEEKVIILLSDGRNNTGTITPLDAAKIAADEGIVVHTIGVGPPESTLPSNSDANPSEEGYPLDEQTLTEVASSTGGIYFRAQNREGLENIYQTISHLQNTDIKSQVFPVRIELYRLFLLSCLICMTAWFMLSKTYLLRMP